LVKRARSGMSTCALGVPQPVIGSQQRRFVTNASHELSTPLATMRATLDVAIADPLACRQVRTLDANLREDLDQADQLLESFLALARAHREQLGDQAPVSLPQLVNDAVATREQAIAAKQIRLRTALAPPTTSSCSTAISPASTATSSAA
jgi:signal transduction histidine kinase